jgi:hypothetical protein
MMKKTVVIGEIVLIPVGNEFVPAKVLYLSHRYKNVILLGIYNFKTFVKECPKTLPSSFGLTVYTSQDPVLKKRWISIGLEPLLTEQRGIAKRIVGGDVWLEDQHLGPASEIDRRSLPQMDVLGAGLVEKKASEMTRKGES